MKKLLVFLFLLQSLLTHAQLILSPDTAICVNYTGTLQALSANESYMFADDQHDSLRSIGFTFDFYGQSYTDLVISGNGYITFDLTQANNYSPWAINMPIPNPGNVPQNAIMAPWHDINTAVSGYVSYGMTGVAPNRKFTVTWCAIAMYSCTADLFTSQVVLHESTNKIEMFIQDKPLCIGWNGGAGIQGLVDATSTNFTIVNDPILLLPRNWPLPWTATNEGWEFIPNGPNDYTYNQITYIPINTGLNQWSDLSGNILGQGSTLPISISTTSSFIATITGSCIANTTTDTVTITIANPTVTLGSDISLACNADTILYPVVTGATYPYTYLWSTGSTDSFLLVNNTNLYSITVTDSLGCQAVDDISISSFPAPSIILDDSFTISCGSDTLVDPIVSGGTSPYTYSWNTGDTDSMITVGDGLYYLTVTDAYGCYGRDTLEILYDSPPKIDFTFDSAVFDFIKDIDTIACNSSAYYGPVSIIGGSYPFTYLWEDASLSFLSSETSVELSNGLYYLTVTDTYGCYGRDTLEIFYDSPPAINLGTDYNIPCNTTTSIAPNIIGGTQPYSYLWNNGSIDSSINIPEGNYTVIVTDLYGCSDFDEIEITEDEPDTITVSGGGSICYGEYLEVYFNFNGLTPWELTFTDNSINRLIPSINDSTYTHLTSESGLYSVVEAKNANGCVAISIGNTEVIVNPLPTPVIVPNEVIIYEYEKAVLSVGNYSYYEWSSDGAYYEDTLSSTIEVSDSGNYYVFVIDENGCTATDTAIVYLAPLTQIFIPSTFTPNGDDHNELFLIRGNHIEKFNIKIFDRWGGQLFESDQIEKHWDGTFKNKKVQQGSYYYQIELVGEDGKQFNKIGTVEVQY